MIAKPDQVPNFPLKKQRVHEVYGAGSYFFAFALAGQIGGPVIWSREGWQVNKLNPAGFGNFVSPKNLLVLSGKNQNEILSASEEAMRSGTVNLVVMEVKRPLNLTIGRRLQLAAREGKTTGLVIISEGTGSNAAETRWECNPVFDPDFAAGDSTLQCWKLIKNKTGTIGAWNVRWDEAAHRVIMVSPVGERPGSARVAK